MLLTSSLLSRILTLMLIRLKPFSMLFVGSVQGLFSCFSVSLRSFPVSHVERSSLCDFVSVYFVVTYSSTGPRKRFREMIAAHVGVTHNLSSLPGLFFVIS